MRAFKMLLPMALFASAASASCSSDPPPAKQTRLCIPGDNVFCKCADLRDGSKRCSDDGMSFSECDCGAVPEDTGFEEEDFGLPPEDTEPPPLDMGMDAKPGAEEACPGKTVAVDPNKDIVIDGNTTGAADDSKGTGACAVATSGEHVYAIVPTGSGRLTIKMTGTGAMDPTLYVRSGDCATGTQMACGETTGAAGAEQFQINVTTGNTYYLFADGKAGASGAYSITMRLTTGSFCGDKVVDTGEGCDDGNKVAGDGCENDCRPSGSVTASDKCPGVEAHVWPGKTLTFTGDTTDANLSYQADSAASCGTFGNNAPDRVYALVAHKTGTMTVEVEAAYNTAIYVRAAPCESGAQIACGSAVGASTVPQTEKVTFSVADGQTYYLVVDGALNYRGTYTVRASVM